MNQLTWKLRTNPDGTPAPSPQPVVSGFVVDKEGNFPIIYRGPNVRSAPNCWSLPSGLHECGLRTDEQLAVELEEELGIKAIPNLFIQLGAYENIRPNNDDWHWVIHVLVLRTLTLETLVNKEPDKHPEIRLFNARDLHQGDFWGLQWAPKLGDFLNLHRWKITDTLTNLCDI